MTYFIQSAFSDKEVLHNTETAYKEGKKVVLNSMPSHKVRKKLLRYVSIVILNESQIAELAEVDIRNIESAKIAALKIYGMGADTVIIELKNQKVLVFAEEVFKLIESPDWPSYWNFYERIIII